MSLKEKLEQASKKAETQKAERRARAVKGSHLTERFLGLARERGLVVTPSKSGAFQVITGAAGKSRRVYVAAHGGTVDLNGFTVPAEAIVQITEDEAKRMHLGKVRGRIDFDRPDEDILAAYGSALDQLNVVPAERPAKAPRAKKAPEAAPAAQAQV